MHRHLSIKHLKDHYFLIAYLAFIAGFFLIPSIRWNNNICYGLLVAPYLVTRQKKFCMDCLGSPIFRLVTALCAYLLLTLIWSDPGSIRSYTSHIFYVITILVFVCITVELMETYPGFMDALLSFICIASFVGAVVHIASLYPQITFPPAQTRDLGTFHNPIHIGTIYGLVLITAYLKLHYDPLRYERWGLYLVCLTAIFMIIQAQSRGSVISTVAALVVASILMRDGKVAIALIAAGIITLASYYYYDNFKEWLTYLIFYKKDSGRMEIFQATLTRIMESPMTIIFGHGILADTHVVLASGIRESHPHNLYLATWLYGGIIGLSLLAGLIIQCIRKAWRWFSEEKNALPLVMLAFVLVAVSTNFPRLIDNPTIMFLIFWLPVSFLCSYERNPVLHTRSNV